MTNRWIAATTACIAILTVNVGVAHAGDETNPRPDSATEFAPASKAMLQGFADFINDMIRANPTLGHSGPSIEFGAAELWQDVADFMNQMIRANPTLGYS